MCDVRWAKGVVPVDERETPTRTGLPRACAPRYFVFPSLTSPLSPALLLPSFFRRAFSILAQPPPPPTPPPPSRSPRPHQPAMPPYFTLLDFSATLLAPLCATSAPLSFSCPLPMSIFSPFLSFLLSVCFASIHETVPRVGVAG